MPFKPGQSGNPKGRPQGKSFRGSLRAELSKPTLDDPSETSYELWARKIIKEASEGDKAARLEVIKFLEGAGPPDKGRLDEDLEYPEADDEDGNEIDV
jgi:Family of unknown function (DUF5681)